MSSQYAIGGSSTPPPIPSNYPGLRGGRGMAYATWQACVDVLRRLYAVGEGSRKLAESFRSLPDPITYPDYNRTVREPESIDNVAVELGNGTFESPEDFFKQLHLVFVNAKSYFDADSETHRDAKRLEDLILYDWRGMSSAGIIPLTQTTNLLPNMPKKRGRPPKDPNKILANANAISTAMRGMVSTGIYNYDSNAYASGSGTNGNGSPLNLNMALSMGQPAMHRQNSDSLALEQMERMHQGVQSQADQAVVSALDQKMQKWQGPELQLPGNPELADIPGSGWWGEGAPDYERTAGGEAGWGKRMQAVIAALKGYKDASGTRLAEVFDRIPPVVAIPYLSFNAPLSFESISINVNASRYRSLRDFDMDMARLFEKARRFHANAQTEYGRVLVLQRLYNALTAPYPLSLPPSGVPEPSSTLFASLPAGPGNARPMHEINQDLRAGVAEENAGFGVTTFRVGSKDRVFTDEARHKGMAYKVGDYVHLINPDDATRPIVGQVFRSFVPTKGFKTHHVTVCWYYYPEQTVHPAEQLFYDHEIFKTGHFCDHPVEDIIERVSVQFYVKAIRGRPLAPEYYPGWPIYVCNSRYNDREWCFVRIKNWNSCIPDELRQTTFMAVDPFERQVGLGVVNSPFLRGVKGPGSIGEPKNKTAPADDEEEESLRNTATPTQRPATYPTTASSAAPSYAGYSPASIRAPMTATPQRPMTATAASPYRPPQAMPTSTVSTGMTTMRPAGQFAPGGQSASGGQTPQTAQAGQTGQSEITIKEPLSAETIRLFERDARGNVLWFSAPPLAPGSIKIPEQPSHSLEYLLYLNKRKQGDTSKAEPPAKRLVVESQDSAQFSTGNETQVNGHTTPSESANSTKEGDAELDNLLDGWWAQQMSPEEVLASVKAVLDTGASSASTSTATVAVETNPWTVLNTLPEVTVKLWSSKDPSPEDDRTQRENDVGKFSLQ